MERYRKELTRPGNWFGGVVVVATLVFFSVLIGVPVALFAGSTGTIATRVDILYKLGLIGAGFVTFFTVVWRGLISSRQAAMQQIQLDKLTEQNAATEVNNLAQQLQKGAELLADDKPARVAAGIATLGAVARTPSARFGLQARDLLLDIIKEKGMKNHHNSLVKRAASELLDAFRMEPAIIHDELVFEEDNNPNIPNEVFAEWMLIAGIERCLYRQGMFYRQVIDDGLLRYLEFEKVRFVECRIVNLSKMRARQCTFYKCTFTYADCTSLTAGTFEGCDFSGTSITVNNPMPDLRAGKNWHIPGHEPAFLSNPGPPIDASAVLYSWYPYEDDD